MRIGVFCSGGDAPGMNACVRAIVRAGIVGGHEMIGIRRGYQGLLDEDLFITRDGERQMTLRSVSDWARHGGTFLRSSRSEAFRSLAGQQQAAEILTRHRIDALIPIGGDGTFHGAVALAQHWPGQIVGCPGTIDNDLQGTDFTIGFSTAVATAVAAVDKIRDTAESHERMFLVEVMGRHSGYIAVHTAIGAGAETICIPETETDIGGIVGNLQVLRQRGKTSVMMVVAEGDEGGGAEALQQRLQAAGCPYSTRVVILGHLQRGGTPTPEDRLLASQLGHWAIRALGAGSTGVMVGRVGASLCEVPFEETYARQRTIPEDLLELVATLSH
ncbi:MAG: 6-phosphofructokinase [Planctomycetaceae bacterium]|nr:6-phosphofructokinase [Planctomycetaceae bacterium]